MRRCQSSNAYVDFDNATVVCGSAEQSARRVLARASSREEEGRASLARRKFAPKALKGTLPVTATATNHFATSTAEDEPIRFFFEIWDSLPNDVQMSKAMRRCWAAPDSRASMRSGSLLDLPLFSPPDSPKALCGMTLFPERTPPPPPSLKSAAPKPARHRRRSLK